MKRKLFIAAAAALVLMFTISAFLTKPSVPTLSHLGSRGNEVISIQNKLKSLGYYDGRIDGIFGPETQDAVIRYQKNYGLAPDGVAGNKTLASLGVSSGGYSSTDTELLSRCVYAEAGGESYQGQVAVAAVVLNRVKSSSFPNSISGVVYQPGAFETVSNGRINLQASAASKAAAQDAINGVDPTYGCIFFYNPDKTSNEWIRTREIVTRIGGHVFAK